MTYKSFTFPIEMGKPTDAMTLHMRVAVCDAMRAEAKARFAGATMAGVEQMTVIQKLSFVWAATAKASRMVRSIPVPMFQWAVMAEARATAPEAATLGYPEAKPRSTGSLNRDVLSTLPGNVVVIRAGGVNATGLAPEGLDLQNFVELRMTIIDSTQFEATVITNDNQGEREQSLVPADGELQDA